jgi:hypothetical protein
MSKPPKSPGTSDSLDSAPQVPASGNQEDDDGLNAFDKEVQRHLMTAGSIPDPDADQGDLEDSAQTSKEVLAKIAENAPPILPGESTSSPTSGEPPPTVPFSDDKDGPEEPKLPKRGGLPPENDPPAA